ncbi:hypothetical protein IQ260_12835 [Leptolyngbya cf. ectocarpi LEGE 11479]|uniref:PEP-CTERM sorting domain-containing protein n=1 Tax=Leptolyngbya cf. ectocarpi LEGE 11479 TaxID=1828722 RepID=A0A928ZUA1_LEPEC|nr:hypothetical protein [Leptolyngbya ectocarpi]MBE9067545.1 hypothetical protein [Leptolyngbya cf. ectocarpi LEGE 11479]
MNLNLKLLTKHHLLLSIFAPLGLTLATVNPAEAFVYSFDSTSQSSNSPATGASASIEFNFNDLSADQIQIDLSITNTTGQLDSGLFGAGATSSKLTGIAFDLFDGLNIVSRSTNGKLDTWLNDVDFNPFSNSVGDFTIALADNNNFTGGNANGAVATGETSTASFVITGFEANTSSTELQEQFRQAFENQQLDIAARFQQVNAGGGSDKLLGGSVSGGILPPEPPSEEPAQVPEPGLMLGMGVSVGLLALGQQRSGKTGRQRPA